jgi:hypothetical protein
MRLEMCLRVASMLLLSVILIPIGGGAAREERLAVCALCRCLFVPASSAVSPSTS